MRRAGQGSTARNDAPSHPTPSVPPTISRILQLPAAPIPRPRTRQQLQQQIRQHGPRRTTNGRRLPPGPPPPRSWYAPILSSRPPSNAHRSVEEILLCPLPNAFTPHHGSLIDMMLHQLAANWSVQKDWNRFYLYELPDRLRIALIFYVSKYHEPGMSISDLRLILLGPTEGEMAEYQLEKPDPAVLNANIHHLDLTGSAGSSMSLKSLAELLFPAAAPVATEVADSWDAPELLPAPTALLPNLTHLSLAVDRQSGEGPSWRQLLSLSSKLPGLTHLNLSGWPTPSTTPNAIVTKMVSAETGRTVSYGATNAYSHALDDDWSEAVSILKRLSKTLYRLEYLDLTGCGHWFPALYKEVDAELTVDFVDWSREWGKITVLRLCSGYYGENTTLGNDQTQLREWKREAIFVEKRIRTQRAGQGHFVTVEKDPLED